MKQLILGGARSGKSRYAEQIALSLSEKTHQSLIYIATATANDDEMALRISHHQSQRDERWQVIEESLNLAKVLSRFNHSGQIILIDCLTLWLSNALLAKCWSQVRSEFFDALTLSTSNILMVGNEVGAGVVPMGELSRQFVDENGWLHQELATICDRVTLVTAGLPLTLKPLALK